MTRQNCISEPAHLLAAGIINTSTDFVVVILPIPTVWRLKFAGREQVILVLLFGIGFMVSIAGCVRTVYTYQASVSNDRTWAIYPVWLSSCVELYVGIVSNLQSYKETFLIKETRFVLPSLQPRNSSATSSRDSLTLTSHDHELLYRCKQNLIIHQVQQQPRIRRGQSDTTLRVRCRMWRRIRHRPVSRMLSALNQISLDSTLGSQREQIRPS